MLSLYVQLCVPEFLHVEQKAPDAGLSQSIQLPLTQDSNDLLPWTESFLSSRMEKGGEINVGCFQGEEQF